MGNQQATKQCIASDTQLAWLAGFLEGEGSLLMSAQQRSENEKGNRIPKIATEVRIYNTDARLIRKCVEIIRQIGIEPWLEEREQKPMLKPGGGEYKSVDPMLAIKIAKPTEAVVFLRAIRPWLFGSKADRADLMLEFLERRIARIVASGKDARGNPYTEEDFEIVQRFRALTRPGRKALKESSTSNEQNAV